VSHAHAIESHVHHEDPKGFWSKYVFSQDHKIIGIQFLISSLLWGIIGGSLAMIVRYKIAWPAATFPVAIDNQFYNMAFTMHASVMIFLVIIPVLVGGFGNFLIPLMIGARDMAFPKLNMLSYWVMWPAFGVFIASFLVSGDAAAGWTGYPPLSAIEPGMGQTLWVVGVILVGWSSIMGAVNYLTTIIKMRAPGMTMFRMPLTVWALFITSILQLMATPVLGSAMIMLFLERVAHTAIFTPDTVVVAEQAIRAPLSAGQPLLFQHLFWFYSHPAVYIMILPAMGFVSDILSTFARKPLFGYRPMVYSIGGIAGLGFIVWGHHMFQSGMNPYLGTAFMISTMMIALPSAVKTFNWLGTLWGGQIHFTSAMCYAIAFVSMFVIGGLSGIFMAATPVDIQIHDTYFIVAHIHYVLFTGSLFGIFGGIYYWFPKMFGRKLDERLGRWHFWLTFIFGNATFFLMHVVGAGGMHRRIADPLQYEHLHKWQFLNQFMTVSAFLLFLSQIPFLVNFFRSLAVGEKAGANPWNANTLEWACPSPPPHGNFGEEVPTVHRGPYEYASPDVTEDYLPQWRDLQPKHA
jgi:cytochrome c oxidase subunit 1